ncbi:response regulator [Lysobacter panacisoli]|uniref:response regulator n=1 Tax=Lysobacter panacisoli TaxID=1255263 RepID=UPI00131B02FC|nr:response regulator [Lysobacter panacisoli]
MLIVDEDLASRQLARTILARAGWEALDFSDAASALDCFRRERIDAVLIGELPGYGGIDVCCALRPEQVGRLRIASAPRPDTGPLTLTKRDQNKTAALRRGTMLPHMEKMVIL